MWAYCSFCGKGFDSHDGGRVKGNYIFCPDCEELYQNGMLKDAPNLEEEPIHFSENPKEE